MTTITGTRTPYSLKGTDWQGSVVNETTSSRALVAGFTSFGYSANPGHGNTGFVGQPREPATGFYLLGNGYRVYSPTLMRFNAADDFSPFERGGLNAYVYCAADPLNNTDPDGHALLRSLSKLVQRIFSGRKAGDIGHLDGKYEIFWKLRDDAQRGSRTISFTRNAQRRAGQQVNLERTGKFGQDVRLTQDERRDLIQGLARGEDIFRDSSARTNAAAAIAREMGERPRPNLLGDEKFQRRIFSKGTTAFNKRIERYERKGALLPDVRAQREREKPLRTG